MTEAEELRKRLEELRKENRDHDELEKLKAQVETEKQKKKGRKLLPKLWKGIKKELGGVL